MISQYYGAKDEESVRKTVHTSLAMTLILAVIFTVVGILMAPYMLNVMLDPDAAVIEGAAETGKGVIDYAKTYLTIYFAGVTGLMVYNMGSGICVRWEIRQDPFIFSWSLRW